MSEAPQLCRLCNHAMTALEGNSIVLTCGHMLHVPCVEKCAWEMMRGGVYDDETCGDCESRDNRGNHIVMHPHLCGIIIISEGDVVEPPSLQAAALQATRRATGERQHDKFGFKYPPWSSPIAEAQPPQQYVWFLNSEHTVDVGLVWGERVGQVEKENESAEEETTSRITRLPPFLLWEMCLKGESPTTVFRWLS
jgi:hypothetical protein